MVAAKLRFKQQFKYPLTDIPRMPPKRQREPSAEDDTSSEGVTSPQDDLPPSGAPEWLTRCHSFSFSLNPRNLESNAYPVWNETLRGSDSYRLRAVHPQFAAWVSAHDQADHPPTLSTVSQRTVPDSAARGVCADFATTLPVLEAKPLPPLEAAIDGEDFDFTGMSLEEFIKEFLPAHPDFEPSALSPSARRVASVAEIKPGPPRRARYLLTFIVRLVSRLRHARTQSMDQCFCIYGSWAFKFEDSIIIIVAAGDYFQVRRITSEWADENMPLKEALKAKAQQRNEGLNGEADSRAAEDVDTSDDEDTAAALGDVDESTHQELEEFELLGPRRLRNSRAKIEQLLARAQVQTTSAPTSAPPSDCDSSADLDELRASGRAALGSLRSTKEDVGKQEAIVAKAQQALRKGTQPSAEKRAELRTRIANAKTQLNTLRPRLQDQTKRGKNIGKRLGRAIGPSSHPCRPSFSREDLELCYGLYRSSETTLFEARSPEEFFGVPMGEDGDTTDWSGVLRLGSELARKYLHFLEKRIRFMEEEERQRHRKSIFRRYVPPRATHKKPRLG
ncbi:hypothetical protein MKEN_00142400 [Mycena kentingensis (nom. inval.)]|nr:hypothetical protein MKEN_00142400 [Mycena kentingensis (nom. inval.)]